ncbi:hypothetical protein TSUD_332130 [Trifolium subterraneum]|uniref:Uncharacterized protein n=1 Tax=Trifolium subterraneum TaxID=3900 RepID=A0A2Z6MBL8_TRISU|nr:hypothetical protein TSUD_332130 [Trifolium subterraneum]
MKVNISMLLKYFVLTRLMLGRLWIIMAVLGLTHNRANSAHTIGVNECSEIPIVKKNSSRGVEPTRIS